MTLITKEWYRIVAYVLRSMYDGHTSFLVGFPSKILVRRRPRIPIFFLVRHLDAKINPFPKASKKNIEIPNFYPPPPPKKKK